MSSVVKFEDVSVRFILQHQRPKSFQDALVGLVHRSDNTSEEFWALKGVSFEIAKGETIGIVGQNGSGKSTMLKLMTRILEPTTGRIQVHGRISALIELGAGFHPDLTGRENIYLNGSILGLGRKEMDERFPEIVAFSELEQFIDTPVKHYSSGMYMRLGFSVATSVDPDILIIDEVLSVGDEAFQLKCLDRISEFKRQGRTIIFVSHGLETVEQLCDRVIWLHHGAVRGIGPPIRTIRSYTAGLPRTEADPDAVDHSGHARGARTTSAPGEESLPAEVDIVGVELLSGDRQVVDRFRTGDLVVVRLSYRLRHLQSRFVLGLQLWRNDGFLVGSTSREYAPALGVRDCQIRVADIEFATLPVTAGKYNIIPFAHEVGDGVASSVIYGAGCHFSVWDEHAEPGVLKLSPYWSDDSPVLRPTPEGVLASDNT